MCIRDRLPAIYLALAKAGEELPPSRDFCARMNKVMADVPEVRAICPIAIELSARNAQFESTIVFDPQSSRFARMTLGGEEPFEYLDVDVASVAAFTEFLAKS